MSDSSPTDRRSAAVPTPPAVEDTKEYALRARLKPATFVGLPIAFVAVALFPSQPDWWPGMVGLVTTGTLTGFAAWWARQAGRRKEPRLVASWGGWPTTQLLRFRGAENKAQVLNYHAAVAAATGKWVPDEPEEQRDAEAADDAYEVAVDRLRTLTYDRKRFPLVFEENVNYGYSRNLFGLKSVGLIVSVVGAGAAGLFAILASRDVIDGSDSALAIAALIDVLLVVAWALLVNEAAVRTAAFSYAKRLLGAAEDAGPSAPPEAER